MSHQFTAREMALLMAREIDRQESAPDDDEYIGDWVPGHSCGGAGDPTCAACWMHSYDRAAGVVAEEPEWEYGTESRFEESSEVYEAIEWGSREQAEEVAHDRNEEEGHEDGYVRLVYSVVKRIPEVPAGPWVPVKQEGAE
jgi:hypothetical protein